MTRQATHATRWTAHETLKRTFANEEDPLASPEGLDSDSSLPPLKRVLAIHSTCQRFSSLGGAGIPLGQPAFLCRVGASPARGHLCLDGPGPVFVCLSRTSLELALRRRVLLFREGCVSTRK